MSDELFNIPAQESPRLKWLKKYSLIRTLNQNATGKILEDEFGNDFFDSIWVVFNTLKQQPFLGRGNTEDEAIRDWAIRNGVKLWNEEDFK